MRLVLVGWPSKELLVIGGCLWGEGLGVDDSWDPASQEQADKRGRKKSKQGESEAREGGRQAHRLHNARLGPVLMWL